MIQSLKSGATLWVIVRGTPTTGYTYQGPYESEGRARGEVEQWQGFGEGMEEVVMERNTWVVPMTYRKGYHVGALHVGLEG